MNTSHAYKLVDELTLQNLGSEISSYKGRTLPAKLKNFALDIFNNSSTRNLTKSRLMKLARLAIESIPNLNSLSKFFTDTRKVLKERLKNNTKKFEQLRYVYSMGSDLFNERRSNIQDRLQNKVPLEVNIDDVIRKIQQMRISDNLFENILLVSLTVGSRFIEVVSVSEYEESKVPDEIVVKGVAKVKDGASIVFSKPVIELTAKQIISIVNYIRLEIEDRGLTKQQLAAKMRKTYNKYGFDAQKARDMYASISYELYADKTKITKSAWISKVLGHQNLATAVNYNRSNVIQGSQSNVRRQVKVNKDNIAENKQEIKSNDDDIEEIQEQVQLSNVVRVSTPNGQKTYRKITRQHDGKGFDRGLVIAKDLQSHGVVITKTFMRKFGVGAVTARKIYDTLQ